MTKRCNDCGLVKTIDQFTPYTVPGVTHPYRRFRPYCKPCASKRTLRYLAKRSTAMRP